MTKYYYRVQNVNTEETNVVKTVRVGNRTLTVTFQWAVASEEQCNMVMRFLVDRARGDPLNDNGNYNRDYNWLLYYMDLVEKDLDAWLDTNPVLPSSLITLPRDRQLSILDSRIREAIGISNIVNQYMETMRWQAHVSSLDAGSTSCLVELGGWNRHQDNYYAFRFLSARNYIGKGDLNELCMEFEVYDE